jgi:hypothetical protein
MRRRVSISPSQSAIWFQLGLLWDAKEHASEIVQFFVVDIFQQGSENARSFARISTLNSILHTVQFETFAEWLDLFSSL